MLTRVNILFCALLVLFSIGLVTSQHRARELFIALERAQSHAVAHEVRWNQLQVEQTELAKAGLIDRRARRELGMQPVASERTLHLSVDPVTRAVSLSQPWRESQAGAGSRARGGARLGAARAGAARPSVQAVGASVGSPIEAAASRTASLVKRSAVEVHR